MAQKPIGYYGEFRPTGVDTSAARRFEALAGLANQVGDIAYQIGAKKAEQVGAEKGEKAGREYAAKLAKPQPKVGPPEEMAPPETKKGFLASMSIEGQAYDAAMKSAYLSQVSTDAKEQIERIAAQYPNDVQGFRSNIGQYTQGLLQGVGDEYREAAEATVNNYVANAETAVFKNEIATNRAQANASRQLAINLHNDESAKMARDGDPDQAIVNQQHHDLVIDSMVASGDLAADDAQIAKDSLSKRIQQQTQLGELERVIFDENLSTREQYEKGVAFVERIRDVNLTDIGPEDKDQLMSVLDSKINSLRVDLSREESEISVETGRVISDLMIAANTGSRPAQDIVEDANKLYDDGVIDFRQRASIITTVSKESQAQIDKAESISKVAMKISGDTTAMPLEKDVNTFYDEYEANFIGNPANQALFVQKSGVVPSRMKERLETDINSGDPVRMEQAIELIDRVDELPGMFGQLVTAGQEAFATQVVTLSEVMPMDQAVKEARRIVDPTNATYIESRRQVIKDQKYPEKYSKWTDDAIGGLMVDMPVGMALSQAERQFGILFENYFTNGLNASQAQQKAAKIMKTNWTDSEFGVMPYAPEQYYPISGEVLRDQAYQQASEQVGKQVKKDNIYLLTNDHTARTASRGQPEYIVMYQEEDGTLSTIYDEVTGQNLYWYPDVDQAIERQKEEVKKSMEERRAAGMTGEEAALARRFAQPL
jgi:polyhydroxyalkanoate synthesis regulator phasin